MEKEFSEDENWLEEKIIQCPNCLENLLWLEHSPFENGYYLYCNSCPKRVDVSMYDEIFIKIEESLIKKSENIHGDKYFELIMPIVEEKLLPCDCGGKFLFEGMRRCVYCSHPVIKGERNLWFIEFSEDSDKADNFYNLLVKKENIWK